MSPLNSMDPTLVDLIEYTDLSFKLGVNAMITVFSKTVDEWSSLVISSANGNPVILIKYGDTTRDEHFYCFKEGDVWYARAHKLADPPEKIEPLIREHMIHFISHRGELVNPSRIGLAPMPTY